MKKLAALFMLFLITAAGNNVFPQIPLVMRERPWLDDQPHMLFGHQVTMKFGEKYTIYRYNNTGEVTSVGYQDLQQTIDSMKVQAKIENWPAQELTDTLEYYRTNAAGGRLFIYLSRYDESQANTKWYFIILRDEKENKILEKNLAYQAPQTPEGTGWYNYYEFLIDKEIQLPFYVYLNNKTSNHLSDFKFFINNP
jgi:hypothetical protein